MAYKSAQDLPIQHYSPSHCYHVLQTTTGAQCRQPPCAVAWNWRNTGEGISEHCPDPLAGATRSRLRMHTLVYDRQLLDINVEYRGPPKDTTTVSVEVSGLAGEFPSSCQTALTNQTRSRIK
jgi:hypothetical protein